MRECADYNVACSVHQAGRVSEREPESVLCNLVRGAMATRAVAVVSELRVADALADGPRPVEEVAREVGADPDTLRRLLRVCARERLVGVEPRPLRVHLSAVLESARELAHAKARVSSRANRASAPRGLRCRPS